MKIAAVRLDELVIPLKKPFQTALRRVDVLHTLAVRLTADSGQTGYGEGAPAAVITGDTLGSIREAVENYIFPAIKGLDVEALDLISARIDRALLHNSSAKAAVELAVYDLWGQRYGIPLHRLFGGADSSIETDITISVQEPEAMAADAREYVADGYRVLKTKVGVDSRTDLVRVQAIRAAVGKEIKIRLDANQGWRPKEAVALINRMEDLGLGIELVEQPVAAHDLAGLKYVTDHTLTPIMADEALFTPGDCAALLHERCVDLINIKLMKCGGLHNALSIAAIAEAYGLQCMMGCMMESKIGVTAAAQLAAGRSCITRVDLDTASLLAEDPVDGGAVFRENRVCLPEEPGLGIKGINIK